MNSTATEPRGGCKPHVSAEVGILAVVSRSEAGRRTDRDAWVVVDSKRITMSAVTRALVQRIASSPRPRGAVPALRSTRSPSSSPPAAAPSPWSGARARAVPGRRGAHLQGDVRRASPPARRACASTGSRWCADAPPTTSSSRSTAASPSSACTIATTAGSTCRRSRRSGTCSRSPRGATSGRRRTRSTPSAAPTSRAIRRMPACRTRSTTARSSTPCAPPAFASARPAATIATSAPIAIRSC